MTKVSWSAPWFSLVAKGPRDAVGLLVCATWAFALCYLSGLRGFFAMDQSIIFDGGWRILQGQVPFVDFFLPHGPLSMWIQAAAFGFLGVSYQSYVLTASIMNLAGACLAYATFRVLVPEKSWPAWAAGLLTGSWLYAPMGTTYIEQTGFVFLWVGIFAVVRGLGTASWHRQGWMALAGLSLAAAILAKTNTGVLAVPFLFLMPVLLREQPGKSWVGDGLALGAGLAVGLAVFWLWLATASDPAAFQRYVLEIAGREGRKRILENKEFHFIICSLLTGKGNDLVRLLTVSTYTLMGLAIALAAGPWRRLEGSSRIRRLGFLGLLWVAYQQLFGITSNNNGINEQPFIALIFVCAVLVILEIAALAQEICSAPAILPFFRRSAAFLLLLALGFTSFFYAKGIRGMGNFDFGLGLLLALGTSSWVLLAPGGPRDSIQARSLVWGGSLVLGILFLIGAWGAYFRQAQDFFNFQTRYVKGSGISKLQGLAWAENVNADARAMHPTWPELVRVWNLLEKDPGRFYLLGNYTFLYALTGKPSVGPLSWFFKGLTYSNRYDPALDQKFVAAVDREDMVFFVTEEDFGLEYKLADFPLLHGVLRTRYQPLEKVGMFRIYRRIPSDQASAPGGNPANSASGLSREGR